MIKLNRWTLSLVVLIVLGALFIDGYSVIYRYLVARPSVPLGRSLKENPHIGSRDVYLHKGLDLQGGTELTIAICRGLNDPPGSNCRNGPPKGKPLSDIQAATITVLSQRVNALGVAESTVQAQGSDQILVQLPGVGLDQATETIGTTAKLHFATPAPGAPPDKPDQAKDQTFISDQENLYDPAQFKDDQFYPTGYHWKIDPKIEASDVTKADVGYDTAKNEPTVTINFNSHGADEWSRITTEAAKSAPPANQPAPPQNRVAIFLDNKVITAPGVQGASSSSTEISGGFTQESAQALASQISAGALPAEIATVQSSEVSATLGQDTVRKSLIAGGVGLAIVVLFMISYYRFPGLLASTALLFYAAIVLALYKLIPVTVTLAGLAGFVLSVGMAVDANVLIFERTRDELRHGRGAAVAVETGFRRAFPAIRDSNLSTLIACVVLYALGSNVVKGFALTLGIGVVVSFF
ncbi:MAG: protein translocase subunit SecD, partial [Actinobacteria bacterium]|nr:protein translocase subunit SecD [Actinomycetota bacterium]